MGTHFQKPDFALVHSKTFDFFDGLPNFSTSCSRLLRHYFVCEFSLSRYSNLWWSILSKNSTQSSPGCWADPTTGSSLSSRFGDELLGNSQLSWLLSTLRPSFNHESTRVSATGASYWSSSTNFKKSSSWTSQDTANWSFVCCSKSSGGGKTVHKGIDETGHCPVAVKAPRNPNWHACHYEAFKIWAILHKKGIYNKACPHPKTKITNVRIFEVCELLNGYGIILSTVEKIKGQVERELLVRWLWRFL